MVRIYATTLSIYNRNDNRNGKTHAVPIIVLLVIDCGAGKAAFVLLPATGGAPKEIGADRS